MLSKYRTLQNPTVFKENMEKRKQTLFDIVLSPSFPNATQIRREALWRSSNFLANSVFYDYFGNHVLSQGSAYLYLHGIDGAPRDILYHTLKNNDKNFN